MRPPRCQSIHSLTLLPPFNILFLSQLLVASRNSMLPLSASVNLGLGAGGVGFGAGGAQGGAQGLRETLAELDNIIAGETKAGLCRAGLSCVVACVEGGLLRLFVCWEVP